MSSSSNAIAALAPSSGEEPAQHLQSLLAAIAGLTSLGTPISPRTSSSIPGEMSEVDANTDEGSIESNESRNHPVKVKSPGRESVAPAASSSNGFGFEDLPSPFTQFSDDPTAMDRFTFTASEQMPPACQSIPYRAREESEAPSPPPAALPKKNFPQTLMEVISSEQYPDIVSWLPHGRGFVVLDKERFASAVLPRHFDGAKFSSFTRRMKRWNFDRVPRGPEMGAYYHKHFVRDRPELVREMRYGAKKKREDRKSEKEKKEQKGEKAAENKKVRQTLSNEVNTLKDDPRGLPREEKYFKPQILSATPKMDTRYPAMDTWYVADLQDRHMPLPSTVPQNNTPKSVVPQKKMGIDVTGHRAKNAKEAATIHKNLEWLKNEADSVRSLAIPPRHPSSETPLHTHQRTIAEREQELLLARSALSQQVADYAVSSDAQRMIELERTKRILEAEIVIACYNNHPSRARTVGRNCMQSHASTGSDICMRGIMPPDVHASTKILKEAMDAVVRDVQLRPTAALVPSLELYPRRKSSSWGTMVGESGPVAMNRKEEEELIARYLVLKRNV